MQCRICPHCGEKTYVSDGVAVWECPYEGCYGIVTEEDVAEEGSCD